MNRSRKEDELTCGHVLEMSARPAERNFSQAGVFMSLELRCESWLEMPTAESSAQSWELEP